MEVFISHKSALKLCGQLARSGNRIAQPCRIETLNGCASSSRDLSELDFSRLPLERDGKLDILVSDSSRRFKSKGVNRHLWTGELPQGALYQLGKDVYVTSPEFSLLLLSGTLPFDELIMLCSEACSRYERDESERGFCERPPLTSAARIHAFLKKAGSAWGTAKLTRALRYTVERARSPLEAALGIFMCMPPRLGGYGLPKPQLNYRIEFDGETARMAGRSYAELDLYFPKRAVAVEYDSNRFHISAERIASDARRNNTLRYQGITVINVTWQQVANAQALDDVMRQIARSLGRRLREPSDNGRGRRHLLRANLLPRVNR